MGSQMVDGDGHVRMIDDRALSNSFNARSRSLSVGVQRPDNVIRILAFVPFVDGKRLQYDKREKISHSRDYRLLYATVVQ
jgi:hypothetical protein